MSTTKKRPGHPPAATHSTLAGASPLPPDHHALELRTADVGWLELRVFAEMFEDAQRQRIACVNRAERAPGVDPAIYTAQIKALQAAEKECLRGLTLCYRRVVPQSIRDFVKNTPGVGEPSVARLLGLIGHPVHTVRHEWTPHGPVAVELLARRVSDLWSYCGHGDATRVKRSGMTQQEAFTLGSPRAKMVTFLIASNAMKQPHRTYDDESGVFVWREDDPAAKAHSNAKESPRRGRKTATPTGQPQTILASVWPYRAVYEAARTKYRDRLHATPCKRCGPSGHPAEQGTPWSSAHQHAAALRLVGKTFLKDLWLATKDAA